MRAQAATASLVRAEGRRRASSSAREDYDFIGRYNGKPRHAGRHLPAAGRQRARGRRTASSATLARARAALPAGPRLRGRPTTPRAFVEVSIREVVKTLVEAMLLVFAGGVPVPAELARDADPDRSRCRCR
ncbi:MAG: hypothetical protein MZW92_78535 [Comamonadaceae bacterium]|nr:hypothetical protein [Comamonadaceae bacterium]